MSATTKPLLTVRVVTDHDCGNYRVGEIDFGIHGTLDEYLKEHGREGRDAILLTLSYLTYSVQERFQSVVLSDNQGQCEAKS